jgi:ATP phosphoribosyltransferase
MIKMALPNKGQLFDPTIELLKACGYKAKKSYKSLSCVDVENGIEFFFLRPGDIPMYVGEGIIDLGITGLDFNAEAGSKASPVLDLHFGHSRLCAAVPKDSNYKALKDIENLRIATSFGGVVSQHFARKDLQIVPLEGAVEISVALGVADCVVDIVETGSTLKQAGLRILGEPLYHSNASLFVHPGKENQPELIKLKKRIEGHLVALKHLMIEYDVPKSILAEVTLVTPGIESPTISPLQDENWVSVKSMVLKSKANAIMDKLCDLGCRGIILTKIESARI